MRVVGSGKHLFGSPFLASQGYTHEASVDDLEAPKEPIPISLPEKAPIVGPGVVSTALAGATIVGLIAYALFFKK